MFKKCKCILIPSEGGIILRPNVPHRMTMRMNDIESDRHTACHMYILSDEEIKEGDWFINRQYMIEEGNTKEYALWQYLNTIKPNSDPKKVIATTDFKCVVNIGGDTLPKPSQSFIDKYITEYNKGNIITDIMVEYETIFIGLDGISKERLYRDILKVNLKDNTISIKRSKESWNRREVEQLIRHFDMTKGRDITTKEFDEWIQDNL